MLENTIFDDYFKPENGFINVYQNKNNQYYGAIIESRENCENFKFDKNLIYRIKVTLKNS